MEQKNIPVPIYLRWVFSLLMLAALVVIPYYYFRSVYEHARRFRPVASGVLYRSGRLTAEGMAEVIQKYGIKTVVNLREEAINPDLPRGWFGLESVPENEVCEENGARMVFLQVETLSRKSNFEKVRPSTIDRFLAIMDKQANHPVMIHCSAGLHRTGILAAIYRMEYNGWSPTRAWYEMKDNGFGESNCFINNIYIKQYVFSYRPGIRDAAVTNIPPVEDPQGTEIHWQEISSPQK